MKVLQTISSISAADGGPSTCTYDLLKALQEIDSKVELVTLRSGEDLGDGEPWLTLLDNDAWSPVCISKNLKRYLRGSDVDIIHANALWTYHCHISAKVAKEKKIPFILTPHGMLMANAIKRKKWKKWPLLKLWFNKDVASATAIHATCMMEGQNIRRFGYKGPIAVIPNPMPPVEWINEIVEDHNAKRIGFLGRLHPVKRVDKLIEGWKLLGEKADGAELVLIGSGTSEYEKYLRKLASECKHGKITFQGFLKGKEKFQMLASLRTLCLVSVYENFGMVVTEALSVGTPVIANITTQWFELNSYNCGWWIDATPENIAKSIEKALDLTAEELKIMGINGKKLIEEHYTAKRVAGMMNGLYQWVLNGGEKPEYVYTLVNDLI